MAKIRVTLEYEPVLSEPEYSESGIKTVEAALEFDKMCVERGDFDVEDLGDFEWEVVDD